MSDNYQEILDQRTDDDQNSPNLSIYQLQKCTAILQAFVDGHHIYAEGILQVVLRFLHVASIEGLDAPLLTKPSSEELWRQLESLPWPPLGGPQPKAE